MKTKSEKLTVVAYGFVGAALFWGVSNSGKAIAQIKTFGVVRLQNTTPGTPDTGHANISGTMKAGALETGAYKMATGATNGYVLQSNALGIGTWLPDKFQMPVTDSVSGTVIGLNLTHTGTSDLSNFKINNVASAGEAVQGSSNGSGDVFQASMTGTGRAGSFAIANPLNVAAALTGTTNGGIGSIGVLGQATGTSGTTYGMFGTSASFNGNGVYGEATSTSGSNSGGRFWSYSTGGVGVSGAAVATTGNTFAGRFEANSTSGRGVFGWALATSGSTYGVWGRSDSTVGIGVYGEATSASGSTIGGKFVSASGTGTALWGESSAGSGFTVGVRGIANSTDGTGVLGLAPASSGSTSGVLGIANSPAGIGLNGRGHTGVFGESGAVDGRGIDGWSSALTGVNSGGYFTCSSSDGRGVFGWASASGGNTYGGRFESDSMTGRGVFGLANANGVSDTPYGVRGSCSTATHGYAVYAVGDMGASGVKPFRIDHPSDPENKYLLHYSSESPFPQNFYNGNVTTDSQGYAWVQLPEYFAEINTNFKYVLTVLGKTFAQAIVSEEIDGNRFQIRTSMPHVKVSWRVDADRNDLRIKANRPTDVREKTGLERGKYQHPEYYGKPKSMGMDYDRVTKSPATKEKLHP